MSKNGNHIRIIISGGGTGGHLFPAISVANAVKRAEPHAEILFVGAEGRMEMQKVPEAGYRIEGLPVAGFKRSLSPSNVMVLWKLLKSLILAARIIRRFKPDAVAGVGGYASGPVLKQAQRAGIPTLIQEQNSYAGVTNRLLSRRAAKICVAYEGMEKYFPPEKIIKTGNPVRHTFDNLHSLKQKALEYFGLENDKPVILVLGGSLGAGTINESFARGIKGVIDAGVQIIWQTGSKYIDTVRDAVSEIKSASMHITGFIDKIDLAYAAADIIVSRSGAGTISELELVGKPVVLVPSPNVAEDHQTHNAMALVTKEAALLVRDAEAKVTLVDAALGLIKDKELCSTLSSNIVKLADTNADEKIAQELLKLIQR